jgi:hypothetical protein
MFPSRTRVQKEKLLCVGHNRLLQTVHSALTFGPQKPIHILTLPLSLQLDDFFMDQLLQLRNRILSKGCMLVVIGEEEQAGILGHMGIFTEDLLFVNSPHFLWLISSRDKEYKTILDREPFEDLHMVLRDLLEGHVYYDGPKPGLQPVNLELMQDHCPKCDKPMTTVTGLVFPNQQLKRWDNEEWQYYNQLLSLDELNGKNAIAVQEFVNLLRKVDPLITPVEKRYSPLHQKYHTAAGCPHCNALRDDFDVIDYRMRYLHSFESRISHQLQYYSVSLEIDQKLINALMNGFDGCYHVCLNGWTRR